jgi:hypothetical protein
VKPSVQTPFPPKRKTVEKQNDIKQINKWYYILLKSICSAKQTNNRENIFTSYSSDKRLISRIYKYLKKINTKKQGIN